MKCLECGGKMTTTRENYRPKELGLSVILKDLEVRRCPQCGAEEVVIPKIEQLHKILARTLVRKKGKLTGEQVRFLRKYLGWSQGDFARHAGVARETVSRWENDREPFTGTADRFLRLAVVTWAPVENYQTTDLDAAGEESPVPPLLGLEQVGQNWKLAAV